MKKLTSQFVFLGPILATILYMFLVPPSIESPVTLSGFFVLVLMSSFSIFYVLFFGILARRRRAVRAAIFAGFTTYVTALSTLSSLNISGVGIALVVMVALLFMTDRAKL